MPSTQDFPRPVWWVPGFLPWLVVAFPITAVAGALALHDVIWKWGPKISPAVDTALTAVGFLASLFWFSYLATLFFGRVSASARQVQAMLAMLWVIVIGSQWFIYANFVPT